MPLIIVTGLPCSGKTYRTQQIEAAFLQTIVSDPANSKQTVQVINSHHASSDPATDSKASPDTLRDQIYNSAAQEKTARAEEFSNIKRALSKDNIVIADCLNYIKGYRYQLWCEAKAAGTRCCVVHVAAKEDECKAWNRERLRTWDREAEIEEGQKAATATDNPRHGKDVQTDLVPESHTALYGDRIVGTASRSRSSSMDAAEEDDTPDIPPPDDTMTLKSLYISDKNETSTSATHPSSQTGLQTTTSHNAANSPLTLPSTPIPPPPSSAHPYSPSTLTSLIMRYEPPSPFSRWDTPLFTIPTADTHPPYTDIWSALFPPPVKPTSKKALSQLSQQLNSSSNKLQPSNTMTSTTGTNGSPSGTTQTPSVKQHQSTLLPTATSSSALQILESTTLEIVKVILSAARAQSVGVDDNDGGVITLSIPLKNSLLSAPSSRPSPPNTTPARIPATEEAEETLSQQESSEMYETELTIPQGLTLSQPFLQRLRRKYTQLQRAAIAHGREYTGMRDGRAGVVRGFMAFVEGELDGLGT